MANVHWVYYFSIVFVDIFDIQIDAKSSQKFTNTNITIFSNK